MTPRMRVNRISVMLAAVVWVAVGPGPAPWPALAASGEGRAKIDHASRGQVPRPTGPVGGVQLRTGFSDYRGGVVASSALAPGVKLIRARLQNPPQRIFATLVAPHAQIRAVHLQAGPPFAPYATVSSAVERAHALIGINGMPTGSNGQPMLVRDDRIVPSLAGGQRHPRTGVGLTNDGSALFVTVDGRRADAFGMTLREFAVLMRAWGAVWAVNLDGGASTAMVLRGRVMNSPSDPSGERLVQYAVVLVRSDRPDMSQLVARLRGLDHRIAPVVGQSTRPPEDVHAFR